jgi:hypothetical protein
VKGTFDARAIVVTEAADPGSNVFDIQAIDFYGVEDNLLVREAGFRWAAQVKDNFQQVAEVRLLHQGLADMRRENVDQCIQVISDYLLQ